MIPLWSIPMALATGNTLVLKPSERDPGASGIIAELCHRAGVPKGVLNIVHGGVDTVNFICDEPRIKAISFVGGNAAGKHIFERGGKSGKRVQANLGAKSGWRNQLVLHLERGLWLRRDELPAIALSPPRACAHRPRHHYAGCQPAIRIE